MTGHSASLNGIALRLAIGGRKGYRLHGFTFELQQFADYIGFATRVSHFPSCTSRRKRLEYTMFSGICPQWASTLFHHPSPVKLIRPRAPRLFCKVRTGWIPMSAFATGKKAHKRALTAWNIIRREDHNSWGNDSIRPHVYAECSDAVG